tara:strand:- start:2062 stop:2331 length:270 start_codon:yes stop_codon:yes gene_type:complete
MNLLSKRRAIFKLKKDILMKNMTQSAAARIQSAEAKANNGLVAQGGFAARAQRAAANNQQSSRPAPPNGPSKTGNPSGPGRGNNPPKSK